ncbi:MAG: twin-arginine translocase subunit TatC [Pseudomonadales bacterium]|jgi:sec-independent protein translocase protein TatC|nr:twin-arginine translocase subunit TatC [Pseudomonadales bacterium]MDP6471782.1 twin-arginine translocase subunit TatC [Pseudomonadales bacterium]MDP6828804.1 twin-arginine translocase subunit TatC [Pseudomonadales bacterium]|tara:strand:- start:256 stop:1014 length:759 start_codon:yes stop_codon:yes gene_type:complete
MVDAAEHDTQVDSDEQPFLSHIIELRSRILRGLVIVLALFVPLYFVANELYAFIAAPLMAHLPDGSNMIATEVASPFLTPFKLAILTSIFAGMPFLLHQIWAFISPGLYLYEKKFAIPLLISSILLFYLGTAFAYFLVFPLVFQFLVGVAPEGVTMMTDISRYLDFVIKMFFAFGIAFEIPIATLLLAWTGIASAQSMATKRPYMIVGCFIIGMLLTPPDVISQLLLAIPAWVLFEIGIVFARMVEKRNEIH